MKPCNTEETLKPFFMNLWRWKCGLIERPALNSKVSLGQEWSNKFEKLMRNRLLFGAYRYGPMGSKDKNNYDRMKYAIEKIMEYKRTGNAECLVDAANMMMLEFEESNHPKFHFQSADDSKHTEVI